MNNRTHTSDDPAPGRTPGPPTPQGEQRCTLNHKHDASCDYGRKAPSEARKEDEQEGGSRRGSIRKPYQVGESHDLPGTSKDSDSDGWDRTTDRTRNP